MKTKTLSLLSLSILVLVMFMGLGSAALTLTEVSVPLTADHNTQVTVTFNLTADQNYTTLDWSNSVDPSKGSWTTLPTTTSINAGQTLTLTAIFTIDEYASGNIADAQIIVNDTTTSHTNPLTFSSTTVNPTPELSVSDATIPEDETSVNITITNTGNTLLEDIELTQSGDFDVSFEPSAPFNLAAGVTSDPITVTITSDLDDLEIGTNSVTITATADDDTTATGTVSIEAEYCDYDNLGDLKITISDIENNGISGRTFGEEEEWFPLEEIEVELEIENRGDEDIDNIEIEWGLYNTDSQEWVIEEQENDFNLKDGHEKTITVTFKLDDVDEFENGDDYVFYVKATGEIDGGDYDGENTCAGDSESIKMIIEDDFVVLYDIEFPEVVQCGAEVQILADVWNIGDDDQDDVYVVVYNKELGINKQVDIGDIDAFEEEKLELTIEMPETADEKWYTLVFFVYDDDDELYETDYNDGDAEFKVIIKVEGSCEVEPSATVSATLESGGKAGQELVIKALVTNTGDELANYELNAAAYAEWASLEDVEPSTIILGAGESKEVLITFKVNKDVSGEKSFDIELVSDAELIVKQPVQVSIEPARFPGITGFAISEGSWYLWAIGALNIILVIIIIIVAMRVARK